MWLALEVLPLCHRLIPERFVAQSCIPNFKPLKHPTPDLQVFRERSRSNPDLHSSFMSFLDIPELDGYKAFLDQSFIEQPAAELPPIESIGGGAFPIADVHHLHIGGIPFNGNGYEQDSFTLPDNDFLSQPDTAPVAYKPLRHQGGFVADFEEENGNHYVVEAVGVGHHQLQPEPSPPRDLSPSHDQQQSSPRQSSGKRIAASKDPAIKARVAAMRKERTPQPSGANGAAVGDTRKRLQPTTSVIQQVTPDNHLLQFGDSSKPVISRKRSNSLPNVEGIFPCCIEHVFTELLSHLPPPPFSFFLSVANPMIATSAYDANGVPLQVYVPVTNVNHHLTTPRLYLRLGCLTLYSRNDVSSLPQEPFPFFTQHRRNPRIKKCAGLSRSRRALSLPRSQIGPGPSKWRPVCPARNLASHDLHAHSQSCEYFV